MSDTTLARAKARVSRVSAIYYNIQLYPEILPEGSNFTRKCSFLKIGQDQFLLGRIHYQNLRKILHALS